ncbi:hypothetical protein JCM11251_003747 [Rhodosporidiobolus azoricus]
MTALQPHHSSSSSSKHSLHLSFAASPPESSSTFSTPHGTPSSSSLSRRIGSWGSATSDTYHALQAFGDESLTALPSPLDFDRDRREFGFLPSSSGASTAGQSTSDWQNASWARSTGRARGNSVFEEIRDGSINSPSVRGWDKPSNLGASTSSWLSTSGNYASHSVPTTNGTNTPRRSSPPADRNPPERSKTLSFFGASTSSSLSSTLDRSNGTLSPPPNPPSRSGSLKDSRRSHGGGHGKGLSDGAGGGVSWANRGGGGGEGGGAGSASSGTVGGWGAFPSTTTTPAPPPPLAPFPSSSPSAALSPLAASAARHDPLRSSVASSSGGSWLDDAADGQNGTGLWTRGRGGSIGSKSVGGSARQASPARYGHDWQRGAEETPSPVSALRPRLAALNTSLSPPHAPLPVSHFSSDSAPSASSTTIASPSHHPLSSLPSAYPPDPPQPPSFSSAASASRAARFLNLSHQGHLLQESDYPARSASVPLYNSSASASIHDSSSSTPQASPQRQERIKKSSDASTASSSDVTSATTTPSRPYGRKERQGAEALAPDSDASQGGEDGNVPPLPQKGERLGDYVVERVLGKGAFSRVALAKRIWREGEGERGMPRERADVSDEEGKAGLFALKLVARTACEENERMRISVLREVEVLKNIYHPSLVSLSATYRTPLYTVLVLDYCPGGELFDFLADWHAEISEGLARRMFTELCSAVGYMHEIGLVHRDIKLENILLTARPFPTTASHSSLLATLPSPFLKLTDFGLSRFINPSSPLLSTRCGSEAYAAPELIMGKKYDGRATDAWALGVVLFAIITGVMPFVEEPGAGSKGRRAFLLRIAKADYRWPGQQGRGSRLSTASSYGGGTPSPSPTKSSHSHASSLTSVSAGATSPPPTSSTFARSSDPHALSLPAVPVPTSPASAHLVTPSVQALVARLLVRDPAKRVKVAELWQEEWMKGEGAVKPVRGVVRRRSGEASAGAKAEDEGWSRRGSELLD